MGIVKLVNHTASNREKQQNSYQVPGVWSQKDEKDRKRVRSDRPLGELSSGREVPPEPPENWLNINRQSRDISSQLSDDFRRCLIKLATVGCTLLNLRTFSPQKRRTLRSLKNEERFFLIRTVSHERGTPADS